MKLLYHSEITVSVTDKILLSSNKLRHKFAKSESIYLNWMDSLGLLNLAANDPTKPQPSLLTRPRTD
jgi:hypothetical protein